MIYEDPKADPVMRIILCNKEIDATGMLDRHNRTMFGKANCTFPKGHEGYCALVYYYQIQYEKRVK